MNAHGMWKITWKYNLLIINITGNFNLEGVIELQNEIKSTVLEKNFASWNRLEIYELNALATPDAISAIKTFFKWYEAQGCKYLGVICREPIQQSIIDKLEITNLIVFHSLNEAESCLLSCS